MDQASSVCSKRLNYSSTHLKFIAVMTSGHRRFLGQLNQFMSLSEISRMGGELNSRLGVGREGGRRGVLTVSCPSRAPVPVGARARMTLPLCSVG